MIPFHKLLIGTAVLFCVGFALWSAWRGSVAVAVVFVVLAAGLGYYLWNLQRFLGR
jgi:UDP-N-acetylmuramyl pentapeptide phosphotransferase/UDP-N-acetylglucosamine-1-phosphate transferase